MTHLQHISLFAVLAFVASPVAAGAPGPPPTTGMKVMWSDAVLIGKVVRIETEAVTVLPYVGAPAKVKMNVATIKIDTGLIGTSNLTHVRVLMVANPERPRPGRAWPVTLADGQSGLFFLSRHSTSRADYEIQHAPVSETAKLFQADITSVKEISKVLADPKKALNAAKSDDRISAAATLVNWYRRLPSGDVTEVAIPAEETKAILKALLDADWTVVNPGTRLSPRTLLDWLGLTPGSPNGLPPVTVKPGDDINTRYYDAFKAWHSKNGDKFEIKKFVPKNEK